VIRRKDKRLGERLLENPGLALGSYLNFSRKEISQAGMKLMGQKQITLSESQRKMDS